MRKLKLDIQEKVIYPRHYHLEYASTVTPREDKIVPIYNWFVFKHAFGRKLVLTVLDILRLRSKVRVLDPFCGSGTTLLATKEKGISAIGFDILPLAVFVSNVKTRSYSTKRLQKILEYLRSCKNRVTESLPEIPILDKSFVPAVKEEISLLKSKIDSIHSRKERDFFMLALLKVLEKFSKSSKDGAFLRLIPEKRIYPKRFMSTFVTTSLGMVRDIDHSKSAGTPSSKKWAAYEADARYIPQDFGLFDAVVTSPPYLNRHDYTRVYALELAVGFVKSHNELKKLRYNTFSSHVEARTVLNEREFNCPSLLREILQRLSQKPLNNSKLNEMIEGYFVDMFRFIKSVTNVLKPGGKVVLVLGNVRFAGIGIPVDQIIVQIAEQAGLRYEDIWSVRFRGNSPQQMKAFGKSPSSENIIFLSKSM